MLRNPRLGQSQKLNQRTGGVLALAEQGQNVAPDGIGKGIKNRDAEIFPNTLFNAYRPAGTPFVVEYSKCSASPGWTSGWIACAAAAASAKPERISLSLPG
jgi:hypothetical protein